MSSMDPAVEDDALPTENVKVHIEALAKKHGVTFKRTGLDGLDGLADTYSRLSDKEVTFDDTQNRLVALARSKVISVQHSARLMQNYMREIKAPGGSA